MLTLAANDLAAREAVRKEHQLALISDAEDGNPIARVSNGVYGFSYSPGEKIFPVLVKTAASAFEFHKRGNGEVFLLGFATPEIAAELAAAKGVVKAAIFPAARDGASELVLIPRALYRETRQYSVRATGAIQLEVNFS